MKTKLILSILEYFYKIKFSIKSLTVLVRVCGPYGFSHKFKSAVQCEGSREQCANGYVPIKLYLQK